ncbi:hypothetical protein [Mucilaginibacter pedocola]|uniref:Uncharacterized protein n=1 Tax=Mucilaginibacter pedocola TaxID=1792845 RepID=A0A1S9PL07_9SPHI|nr:hypothetical protein [Mucilaginibacter pedocola]OOQ61625.1 hypothetical protein BC343_00685 [Mucilaginibacter pedocola]
MKNITFQNISDSYQLVSGAKIKSKKYDEVYELGAYDGNKRGYTMYAFENGLRFDDFAVIISEYELMDNYQIEVVKANKLAA